ncbi:hypothetical protein LXL04_020915 [Taraxacum kok-saghyz]
MTGLASIQRDRLYKPIEIALMLLSEFILKPVFDFATKCRRKKNGGDCGEYDDVCRDLINSRLISDEFLALKTENVDDRSEVDVGKDGRGTAEDRVRSRKLSIAERRAAMRGGSDGVSPQTPNSSHIRHPPTKVVVRKT